MSGAQGWTMLGLMGVLITGLLAVISTLHLSVRGSMTDLRGSMTDLRETVATGGWMRSTGTSRRCPTASSGTPPEPAALARADDGGRMASAM